MIELAFLLFSTFPDTRPQPCEATRFPSQQVCQSYVDFNSQYRQSLVEQQSIYKHYDPRYAAIQEVIKETDDLREVWSQLNNIRQFEMAGSQLRYFQQVSWFREQLQRFKDKIGDDAFYTATLPPPVPIWRFREIE